MSYWSLTKVAVETAVQPSALPPVVQQKPVQQTVVPPQPAKPVNPAPTPMPSAAELQQFIQKNTVNRGSFSEAAPTPEGAAQYRGWLSSFGPAINQQLKKFMPPGLNTETLIREIQSVPEKPANEQLGVVIPNKKDFLGKPREAKPADVWVEPMLRDIARSFMQTKEYQTYEGTYGEAYASALFGYFDAYTSSGHVKKWYNWLAGQSNKIAQDPQSLTNINDPANFAELTGGGADSWSKVRTDLYRSYKQQETQPTDEPNVVKAVRQAIQLHPQDFAREVLQHMYALRKGEQMGGSGSSYDQTSSEGKNLQDRFNMQSVRDMQDIDDDAQNPNIPTFQIPSSARQVSQAEQVQLAQLYQEFQQLPNAQIISQRLDESSSPEDGVRFKQYIRDFPIAAQKAPLYSLYGFDADSGQALWEQMMPMIGIKLDPRRMGNEQYIQQNIALLKEHLADEDPEITAPLYQHFYEKGQEWLQKVYDHQQTSAMKKTGNFQPEPTQLKGMGRLAKIAGGLAFREWRQLKANELREGKESWTPNSSNAIRRWALISTKFPMVTNRLLEARQVIDNARQQSQTGQNVQIERGGYIPLFEGEGERTGRFLSVNNNNEYQISVWQLDEGGNRVKLVKDAIPVDDHNIQMLSYAASVQEFIPQALDKIAKVDPKGLRKKEKSDLSPVDKAMSGETFVEPTTPDRCATYRTNRARYINNVLSQHGLAVADIKAQLPQIKSGSQIRKNPDWIDGVLRDGLGQDGKPLQYSKADFDGLARAINEAARAKGTLQNEMSSDDIYSRYAYEYDKYNTDDLTLINNAMPMMAAAYAKDLVGYKRDMTFRGFGKGTFDKDTMFSFIKIGGLHKNWLNPSNPDVQHGKPLQDMFPNRSLLRQQFDPENEQKRQEAIQNEKDNLQEMQGISPFPYHDQAIRRRRLVDDPNAPGGVKEEFHEPNPSMVTNNIFRSMGFGDDLRDYVKNKLIPGNSPGSKKKMWESLIEQTNSERIKNKQKPFVKIDAKGNKTLDQDAFAAEYFLKNDLKPKHEKELEDQINQYGERLETEINQPLASGDPKHIEDYANDLFYATDHQLKEATQNVDETDPNAMQQIHNLKEQKWHDLMTKENARRAKDGEQPFNKSDFARHFLETHKKSVENAIAAKSARLDKIRNSNPAVMSLTEQLNLYAPQKYLRQVNPTKPNERRDDPNRALPNAFHPSQTPYDEQSAKDYVPVEKPPTFNPNRRWRLNQNREQSHASILNAFYKYADTLDRLGNVRERLSRFAMSTEDVDHMLDMAEAVAFRQIELISSGV